MKALFFQVPAGQVVRVVNLSLSAAALALTTASAVSAAPRSEMVTPGYKPCAQRQVADRSAPVKTPTAPATVAHPDRGHVPAATRIAAATSLCVAKSMS